MVKWAEEAAMWEGKKTQRMGMTNILATSTMDYTRIYKQTQSLIL